MGKLRDCESTHWMIGLPTGKNSERGQGVDSKGNTEGSGANDPQGPTLENRAGWDRKPCFKRWL